MKKLLVANWKANPLTEKQAVDLARETDRQDVVICPPLIFFGAVAKTAKKSALGAQNFFCRKPGPFTGEISARQLKKAGARYVILGHSERRIYQSETDLRVAQKFSDALAENLTPIVCVGETKAQKFKGETKAVLSRQLAGIKKALKNKQGKCLVAYEPIWSISSFAKGKTIEPKEAHAIISYIHDQFKGFGGRVRILYGGSVDDKNIKDFLSSPLVSGALIGSASVDAKKIKKILELTK